MSTPAFTLPDLFAFIKLAARSTYPAGLPPEKISQRPDFIEWNFSSGDWNYRDSYTGFYRSGGSEIVRYQDQIVWSNSYGGGMMSGLEDQAQVTFDFLKTALSQDVSPIQSVRGPSSFSQNDWKYSYVQQGGIDDYTGREEIYFQGKLYFFHHTMGGAIIPKK